MDGHLNWNNWSLRQWFFYLLAWARTVPSPWNDNRSFASRSTYSATLSPCWISPFKSQLKSHFLWEAFHDTYKWLGVPVLWFFLMPWMSSILALTTLLLLFIWMNWPCLVPYCKPSASHKTLYVGNDKRTFEKWMSAKNPNSFRELYPQRGFADQKEA